MIRASLGVALSFVLCCGATIAKDANVGDVALKLPLPPGYCELDRSSGRSDTKMIDVVEGMLKPSGNRLLALGADCEQLRDWRTGKRKLLDNLAQYQTLVGAENASLQATAAEVIKRSCEQMRAQGEKIAADELPRVQARAEEVIKMVKVNGQSFLGVIAEEPAVCYAAILQKFKTESGDEKNQVTVFAATVVAGKLVYFYLFAPYVSGSTVTDLLVQQKAQMVRLRAANSSGN
jgi:hypothetical protein